MRLQNVLPTFARLSKYLVCQAKRTFHNIISLFKCTQTVFSHVLIYCLIYIRRCSIGSPQFSSLPQNNYGTAYIYAWRKTFLVIQLSVQRLQQNANEIAA